MGLMGQLVGGVVGFAFGGPLGAILGAVVGGSMGSSIASPMNQQQKAQTTYFVTTFSMLAKMAQADGKIDQSEIELIKTLINRKLGLAAQEQELALRIFNQACRSSHSFDAFAEQFYMTFNTQPQLLRSMLDLLTAMAMADGVLSPEEDDLLNRAARIFKIGRTHYENVKKQFNSNLESAYAVLDCDLNASDAEIKKQYRKLVREFHPDTIISKGLPEEFIKFAREKFQEIQNAYEQIKKARNMN